MVCVGSVPEPAERRDLAAARAGTYIAANVPRKISLASAALVVIWAQAAFQARATELLSLDRGSSADEVVLHWTGGTSPWEVFRSTDPATVLAPANRVGQTGAPAWTDVAAPDEPLVFYHVGSCGVPAAPQPHGCANCDVCDTWGLSWPPVACADRYAVRWKCTFNPEQLWNVFATSVEDICFDIGMCERCSSGVVYIRVQACSGSGCSLAVDVPAAEIPHQCGGGCCVP